MRLYTASGVVLARAVHAERHGPRIAQGGLHKEDSSLAQQTVDRENLLERFALPEKYAGYGLCDPEGKEIGKVKEIFVNEEHEPVYIRVGFGLFGLGSVLIPVQSVTVDEEHKKLVLE